MPGDRILAAFAALALVLASCAPVSNAPMLTAGPGNAALLRAGSEAALSVTISDEFPLAGEVAAPGSEIKNAIIRTDKALVFGKSDQAVIVLLDIETESDLHFFIKPGFPETGKGRVNDLEYEYYVTNQKCMLQYVMYYPVREHAYLAVSYVENAPGAADSKTECREWNLREDLTPEQTDFIRGLKHRAHQAVAVTARQREPANIPRFLTHCGRRLSARRKGGRTGPVP